MINNERASQNITHRQPHTMKGALVSLVILSFCQLHVRAFTAINNKLHEVHFEYPGPAISERDLPICPPHAVCSVLHRRFWAAPIVKRLCRCLKRIECPWEWGDAADNNTMHLDNRSQLKFCDEVSDLPQCNQKKTALTVATTTTQEYKLLHGENGSYITPSTPQIEEERKLAVNVSCLCPPSHAWREQPQKQHIQSMDNSTTIITYHRCKLMRKCSTMEFCGNIRADYFSIYYHCSCPEGHMCLNQNRTAVMASELLYDGLVYKAFCLPNL